MRGIRIGLGLDGRRVLFSFGLCGDGSHSQTREENDNSFGQSI